MKIIFLLGLIAITAQAQSAPEVPNYLKEQLDENSGSTAFQLVVNDTIENISKEKTYRDNVTTQVKRDLKGFESSATVVQGASASLTLAGVGGTLAVMVAGRDLTRSGSSVKQGLDVQHLSGTAVMSVVGGAAGFGAMELLVNKDVVINVLNDTKADEYAASTSGHLAKFFRLSKNKEMALKFAIKEEIYRKNKAKDLTPIDIQEIIKNTKYSGQPVVSEKELAAFQRVHEELMKTAKEKAAKTPELSTDDKIGYLIAANAMLEVQIDTQTRKNGGSPLTKVKEQIAANRKLLHELEMFKKTQDPTAQKEDSDKDKEPASIDAE